ncbi:MAG: VWA domain-containing protein [Chloroflexi bacterium]|nr:VWA domain-containing protein [Chloroflexota bacterium]
MRAKASLIIALTLGLVMVVASVIPVMAQQDTTSITGMTQTSTTAVFIKSHRVSVEITNQIAHTTIEQVFVNEGSVQAEGTYVFPLPRGVTISDLKMIIDGVAVQAQVLEKDEARAIYDQIVRQMRDPALLEYVGTDAIQANVFPIPAGGQRTLQIEYTQLLPVESGLVHYVYPLQTRHVSPLPVGELSIHVSVESNDPISNIYSPTHPIAIDRKSDTSFAAGFETTNTQESTDFSLYYGVSSEDINLNLLTYRESASEDGFFVVLVAPPVEVDESRVIPKDVIVVLDQSGSMFGEKWDQARTAAKYVLDNLNSEDRFNLVVFSTGVNIYANDMQGLDAVGDAKGWISGLEAIGGTNIDDALQTALNMNGRERQTVVLFLTDGLATEGETNGATILANVKANAPENVRFFTFGVGDDVDTVLLDQLSQNFGGTSAYVRPTERVDEEVSTLYNKINSPVLTDLNLEIDGVSVYDVYPAIDNLPDLFVGSQLIITGRYRGDADNATLRLSGKVENDTQSFTYSELDFRANAGGEELIPRLWATRRIGELLNQIRLNGENPELVDSIVRLSIRYGIITPYTSFLITEDDIFSQAGRDEALRNTEAQVGQSAGVASGSVAVQAAEDASTMSNAPAPAAMPTSMATGSGGEGNVNEGYYAPQQPMQVVGDRTFVWRDGVWIDTTYDADTMEPEEIVFLSDAYFELLDTDDRVAEFYAVGEQVIFVLDGKAYEVVPE